MRFTALVYKEIRECAPWVLFASVFLFACGFISLWLSARPNAMDWRYHSFGSNTVVEKYQEAGDPDANTWQLFESPFIAPAGIFLFLFSTGLGIVLGIRQYWVGFFTKTWGFLLHRSVNKAQILAAKVTAGAISFVSILIVWMIFCLFASNRQYFPIPPSTEIFTMGLMFICFGFIVCLATALAGLSRAKWYATKMFSFAFAVWMFITLIVQWKFAWAWLTLFIAAIVLLIQITDIFLNREFE